MLDEPNDQRRLAIVLPTDNTYDTHRCLRSPIETAACARGD